ncbi:MAG: transporter related protein [Parcubacteria group bacterium]|nr:transporter related protein [Parcubacteria group bacterium]
MKEFRATLKRIATLFAPFKRHLVVILLFLAVAEFLGLASPFLLGKLVNGLQSHKPFNDLLVLGALMLASWLTELIVMVSKDVYEFKHVAWQVNTHLTDLTIKKILTLSIGQHKSQHSGLTQSVVSQGQNAVRELVWLTLFVALPLMARLIVVTAAIFWVQHFAGSIILGGVIAYGVISFREQQKVWPKVKKVNDKNHRSNKHFSEILRNTSLIQVNSQERRMAAEHGKGLKEVSTESQNLWIEYAHRNVPRYVLPYLLRFVVLMIAIQSVYGGRHPFGDLVVLVYWTNQVTSELWMIGRLQRQWIDLSVNMKKYFAILDIEPMVKVVQNPVRMEGLKGRIEFRDVVFAYPTTRYIEDDRKDKDAELEEVVSHGPALRSVSFVIEQGESVAFVGASGAGKSTIISLLLRGYDPDEGQILVDTHDLRLVDLKRFREQVGLVEQNVVLLDKSLRDNILFGLNGRAKDVTEERLDDLARSSAIDQFRHRLTKGWDTRIGENGVELSGGERQRVGIARALIKDPAVLVLDEATSSLDAVNEHLIKEAVRTASKGRTTIIIAHRLSTVRDVDKIFVMNKGQIVATGRHEVLYRECEIYRELVEKQLFAV